MQILSLSCAALNFSGTVVRTFLLFRDLNQLQCIKVTDILVYAIFLSMDIWWAFFVITLIACWIKLSEFSVKTLFLSRAGAVFNERIFPVT